MPPATRCWRSSSPRTPSASATTPARPRGDVVTPAGWVSGSCFLARRSALEELGGFDEAYFMYLEDTDLCWRAHDAGWGVGFAGTAEVTHVQGFSTARHPYKMMVAHHRSALRFTFRTTKGWRRAALPLAALVLGVRMGIATLRIAVAPASALGGHRPLLIVAIVAIGVTVVALTVAALVSGPRQAPAAHLHVEPQVTFALPPAGSGCTGATAEPGGARRCR